ncbi:MAG: Gfo/Idh/MocA family oxidoreductase [Pirellulaceae bacterium]|jgi:predicted dehydrogenase|nr:Gfo/Idh/MocA family oxidoreductase [Pirellulaceae bacterium]MDP7016002.1 Gfo/Idh/MocA family oxidoreductase [Pirellulaceae bacterium]
MRFRVGVLGATGFIGTPYRSEIRESPDDATIVALCARRRDLLEAAGREDGAQLVTDDWRSVVQHPDVNLVVVATPDALHHEAVLECARQGKHIFCEKPVGMNATESGEMWDACRKAELAHYVPFWTRYVPTFVRAREVVRGGELGEIKAVIYRWQNPRPEAMPFTWRDDAKLSAAGSIADVGSHAYDAMRWILGDEATRVLAHADVITPPKPDLGAINLDEALEWGRAHATSDSPSLRKGTAYDYADIAFEFAGGAVGSLVLSHASCIRKGLAPELEIHGDRASLAIHRISSVLTIARGGDPPEEFERVEDNGLGNRFAQHVFPALREQLAGKPTEHPNLHDGWRVQEFTDAVVRSVQQGAWIELTA